MDFQERRQMEREIQKKNKERLMIEAAISCFCEKGIEQVTMNEIAAKSNIGVATVYRYFETKESLAMRCAMSLWEAAIEKYRTVSGTEDFKNKNGLRQIETILRESGRFYEINPKFYAFMYFFDNYLSAHPVDDKEKERYEQIVGIVIQMFFESIEKGIEDKSIKIDATIEEIHMCMSHVLFSMLQKLAGNGALIQQDEKVTVKRQVDIVITLLIRGLQG